MGVSVFHCYLRPTNLLVISAGPPWGSYSRCCSSFLFFSLKQKQDAMTMAAVGAEARMERSFILGQGHLTAIQEFLPVYLPNSKSPILRGVHKRPTVRNQCVCLPCSRLKLRLCSSGI